MKFSKYYMIILYCHLFFINGCSQSNYMEIESPTFINEPQINNNELKVLSWNIKMLPAPYGWFLKRQERAENIIQLLKNMEPYDVIFFQEAFSGNIRKKIYEGLKYIYPFQVEPDDQISFYKTNSGLWTISQLPIKLKKQITFSKFKETDWMASKGAKLFSLIKGKMQFNLINTHMQSDYDKEYSLIRKYQYLEIHDKLIFPNDDLETPLILIGDLNIDNPKKLNIMLQKLNLKNGPLMGNIQHSLIDTGKKLADYILVKEGNSKFKSIKRKIIDFSIKFKGKDLEFSDHYPIEAIIIW